MDSHWIPDDDFLLRKSIENGASLESLAKGAIKFSRKFTLSELTNRWRSLLYDPNVRSLSSSIGFDFQYSTQLFEKNHHHTTQGVRSQYYTTARKRIRVEEPPNYNNEFGNHNNADPPHAEVFGAATLDFLDDLVEFDESQFEILRFSFPEIMQDQDHGHNNDDDTTQHVLLQEEFQDPHQFQQEEECHNAMLLSELDHNASFLPLSKKKLDLHPEIKDGIIICILNKESDEILDNSDFNPHRAQNLMNPSTTSVSSLRKHLKPPLPPTRISPSSLQAKGNETVHSYGFGDSVVATQESLKDSFSTEKATSNVVATTSEIEICQQIDMKNPSTSEEEENNNEIESDEDLPSFSDVEAMILDMDLEPVGQDQFQLEASKYRNKEAARMIMRLEQSFESHMNRDIASHGAVAILYGSSKHYIKKQEVLLGRATEDYPVDIDLGKSEKVSRRQALITLKQDGCFEIKNLGKLPIWMNDKEIEQGEVVNLKNHCLIQIREMWFIFETNEKAVNKYLDGIHI